MIRAPIFCAETKWPNKNFESYAEIFMMVFLEKFAFTIVYHFLLTLLLNNKLKNDLSADFSRPIERLSDFDPTTKHKGPIFYIELTANCLSSDI